MEIVFTEVIKVQCGLGGRPQSSVTGGFIREGIWTLRGIMGNRAQRVKHVKRQQEGGHL